MKFTELWKEITGPLPFVAFLYGKKFKSANDYTLRLLGYSLKELRERHVWDIVCGKFRKEVKDTVLKKRNSEYDDLPVLTKKGEVKRLKLSFCGIETNEGLMGFAFGADVSKERELELVLTGLREIIAVVDSDGTIRYKSPSVRDILGWEVEEVVGKHFSLFVHPEEVGRLQVLKEEVFKSPGKVFSTRYRVKEKGGDYRWMDARMYLPPGWKEKGLLGAVICERDTAEERRMENDPLTGLPNRFLLEEKLKGILRLAGLRGEHIAVVMLNVLRFRDINVTYGFKVGDRVLKEIANRLLSNLRSGDIVGRFVADEFCIVLTGLKTFGDMLRALEKIRSSFEEPFEVEGRSVLLSVCIGVALFPRDGEDAAELIRKSEIALSKAEENGPGSVAIFSKDIEREIHHIVALKNSLKDALERGDIKPYYQPILNLRTLRPVGVEALARWEHPSLGPVSPEEFIHVAEDSGLIAELGKQILVRSVEEFFSLLSEGYNVSLGVNFSARQFMDRNLERDIKEVLNASRFPASSLVVEITESVLMEERARRIIRKVKGLGVKVAIDDFGTGCSSMEYLLGFDVDKIKIDRRFVASMVESAKAEGVVRAVVKLCESIGAVSVAEGVESEGILEKLREVGCSEGQGYYFAPPMSFEELKRFLGNRNHDKDN